MENLIKAFLEIAPAIYGDGSGSGDGDGSGSGDGYGYGYGYGDGSGSGYGYGDGSGDGDGDGSGDGDGDGYGYGYGYGDGSGSGDGDGSGSGDGYGYGDGSGYGYGDQKKALQAEYRKGFLDKQIHSFKTFKKKSVYYIDNIPCTFSSIVNNVAKVEIIKDDMSTRKMYIAKSGNLFAHGDTKANAVQAVNDKFFASLSFGEKKQEFIKLFKKDQQYSNRLFFEWHHHLTGSCKEGRLMFVQAKGINLDETMTPLQFLYLTEGEYEGLILKEIFNEME